MARFNSNQQIENDDIDFDTNFKLCSNVDDAVRAKYTKPATGIPESDLASDVREKLNSEVTESTVSGWGFTKNTGNYTKPSTGIPKSDLSTSVQSSLEKADSALQSMPVHLHTVSDVNGLASALADKANVSDIPDEYDDTEVRGLINGKANSSHTHAQNDITGLSTALSAKADASNVYTKQEIDDRIGVIDSLADLLIEAVGV